jgi:hypothetical protein
MRDSAFGHRDDVSTVELKFAFLLVFPGKEGFHGPWPVQHYVHS